MVYRYFAGPLRSDLPGGAPFALTSVCRADPMNAPSLVPGFVPRPPVELRPWQTRAALVLTGFTAILAQIVILRELIVVFDGNEITLGLMLANWLLWTAFGSSVLGSWARVWRAQVRPCAEMAALQVIVAGALPYTIFAVRASRNLFHALPGESLGPGAILLTSWLVLSVFCSASGWLFAAGARLHREQFASSGAVAGGSVYLMEAIGSALGGLAASVLLARQAGSFQLAALAAGLNLGVGAGWLSRRRRWRRWLPMLVGTATGVLMLLLGARLEEASLSRLWRGLDLVASRNSAYGNLAVVQTEGTRTLYENGLVMFNVPAKVRFPLTCTRSLVPLPTTFGRPS